MIDLGVPAMLMIACAMLAGLGLASILVDRDVKRRQLMADRLAKATRADLRTRKVALRSLLLTHKPVQRDGLAWLFRLPGFDIRRPGEFPRFWWIPLLAGLALGRASAGLALDLTGPVGWLAMPAVMLFVCRTTFAWIRQRQDAQLLLQFPDALGMLVRSVQAGLPLTDAVRVVARELAQPTAGQFQIIVNDMSIGMAISESLTRLAERTSLAEYHFFATALTLQSQTGGRLSETLDALADMIRKRVAAKDRALALASEARTSAMILAALPILATAGLSLLNWPYMSVLFLEPKGHMLLGMACGSLCLGLVLMQSIIRWSVS
jgi:tight adherence protein B